MALEASVSTAATRLAARRAFIYQYVLKKHYELKFSGVASDIFSRIRERVDAQIGTTVPDALRKLTAIYDNLLSENPEDWANAVHSCRRILQALADALFPPETEDRVKGERRIRLGPDQYINRLMCYAEDCSDSGRFLDLVGSNLAFLGDRLDAVFTASQKGSHSTVSQQEADRYVVYTYVIVGDVLSLVGEEKRGRQQPQEGQSSP